MLKSNVMRSRYPAQIQGDGKIDAIFGWPYWTRGVGHPGGRFSASCRRQNCDHRHSFD